MACARAQPHLTWGVQQGQQTALDSKGQIPVPRTVSEWKKTVRKLPLKFQFDLVAQLLHCGSGTAVQCQRPEHIPAFRPPDEGIRLSLSLIHI